MKISDFFTQYTASRKDVKPSTRENLATCGDRLDQFFPGKDLDKLTLGDVDKWVIWLKCEYAPATVGRTIKRARQFYQAALRQELVKFNPFTDVRCPGQANSARNFFVDRDMAEAVFEACPTEEWKWIFGLVRYGGLRCPSELLALGWEDFYFDRIMINSPKTGTRTIPFFSELRQTFRQLPGPPFRTGPVITKSGNNWRGQFHKIIKKAGLKPWPRVFHNLRASRETELAETFPIHVVAAWMGNSALVAAKHYLTVNEGHFQKAMAQ